MSITIIIDPGHDFFGAFSTGYVTFWLGSILIESSHVTKNPCDPARCSVFTLAILSQERQETFPCPKTACSSAPIWVVTNNSGPAKNKEGQLEVMQRLAIECGRHDEAWDEARTSNQTKFLIAEVRRRG